MADGSLNPQAPVAQWNYVANAPVCLGQEFVVDFGIPSDQADSNDFRRMSERLAGIATACLRVALVRGKNDGDMPGTFAGAVEGAWVLLQLSTGLRDGAAALLKAEEERRHG